jgi:hypothetical protein
VWIRRIKGERFRVNEFAGLQDLTPAFFFGLQTRLQSNVGGACRAGHALWVWIRRIKGERFRVNEFAGLQDLTPAFPTKPPPALPTENS